MFFGAVIELRFLRPFFPPCAQLAVIWLVNRERNNPSHPSAPTLNKKRLHGGIQFPLCKATL
jgi:hypothetical protein